MLRAKVWNPGTDAYVKYPKWNELIASMKPFIWLKLDEVNPATVAVDASGNGYDFVYANGASDIPNRAESPLVEGSTYSLITNGVGNDELTAGVSGTAANNRIREVVAGSSWTFGAIVKSTATSAEEYQWSIGDYRCGLAFNYNALTGATASGTLSMWYDNAGAIANALVVASTGWNDGNAHALFYGYDQKTNRMAIWLDGVRIATRVRLGTRPTAANISGSSYRLKNLDGIVGLGMDEALFFGCALSEAEHEKIASYVL